ncbi:MAG: GIY-YIG nuclease family protein [Candidatus Nomurabacteria bacterium]|jgi:excinuclease ABC subunit C|nr:GIY-YIG nuclease family protein [Candidatus Nomurabacteria bacterium]
MNQSLQHKLKTLPIEPGVYFHKNQIGEVIYVGKAANLKNRVRNYFQKTHHDDKTKALIAEIFDTDWRTTDTELDALFLESEMIKRYKPKFNILMMDDKSASFVRIDMKSDVPFVSLTRSPMDDNAEYFGPYYGTRAIKNALNILRKIFPFYDKPYNGKKTLNTDIGLTPGIEIGKVTPKEYKKYLRSLINFINGKKEDVVKRLAKEMQTHVKKQEFEKAATIRNMLFYINALRTQIVFGNDEFLDISSDEALKELQKLLDLENPPRRIEGYDISHQSGANVVASMVVFKNGVASRKDYRKFKIKNQKNDDYANMHEVISRRLKHLDDWGRPDLMVIDGGQGQLQAVADLLNRTKIPYIGRNKSGNHSKNAHAQIIIPKNGGYKSIVANHHEHFAKLITRIDDESHRFAINYHTLLKRKNILK